MQSFIWCTLNIDCRLIPCKYINTLHLKVLLLYYFFNRFLFDHNQLIYCIMGSLLMATLKNT